MRDPVLLVAVVALLGACTGAQRPILYPNSHYGAVGRGTAERDIEECIELSRDHGVRERRDGKVAQSAAAGATIGGVTAGAWSAALEKSNTTERAAAGAVAGGTVGAVTGTVRGSDTSAVYKRFVQRCLVDRGYDVVGWQ